MPRRFLAIALLVASTGAMPAEPATVGLPGFQCTDTKESVRLPKRLSQLRKLGTITDEQIVNVEELEGYKAVEKLLRFKGLYIQVITFTNNPEQYNLAAVYLESAAWNISPIRIGEPSEPVLRRLGVKRPDPNSTWRFTGESESLYVEAQAGKVFKVVYECYTG